jgi:hypothetical protein
MHTKEDKNFNNSYRRLRFNCTIVKSQNIKEETVEL